MSNKVLLIVLLIIRLLISQLIKGESIIHMKHLLIGLTLTFFGDCSALSQIPPEIQDENIFAVNKLPGRTIVYEAGSMIYAEHG